LPLLYQRVLLPLLQHPHVEVHLQRHPHVLLPQQQHPRVVLPQQQQLAAALLAHLCQRVAA
jgi:hypothetical protein